MANKKITVEQARKDSEAADAIYLKFPSPYTL
jgi:hypothetical protein